MKAFLDCIPCVVRQSLEAARLATADERIHEQVLREVLQATSQFDFSQPPPLMGQFIHQRIRQLCGNSDPYRESKDRFNRLALDLLPPFAARLQEAPDPWEMAVRLAIVGNVMDLGVKSGLTEAQVRDAIDGALSDPLDGSASEFREAVAEAHDILYLTDNAGEIVFDRLLIERMPREKTTVVVRGSPVINDATRRDAEAAGITGLVPVIDNGSDAPGTILADCSDAFRRRFAAADLIVAKGQGNYETLSDSSQRIHFLLRVKCPVIARDIGSPLGSMVLRRSRAWMPGTSGTSGLDRPDGTIRPYYLLQHSLHPMGDARMNSKSETTPNVTAPEAAAPRIPLIGESAPGFVAVTTQGTIRFPDDYKGKWVILFSHPADFTPVCTTEFMTFAAMIPQFDALNCALIGLSIDSNYSHIAWLRTIKEKIEYKGMKNVEVTFPVIADLKMEVARAYGMLHPSADDSHAVRGVFIIDPRATVRAVLYYPQSAGRNFDELLRLLVALQTADAHKVATPADWRPGDEVIVPPPGSCGVAQERMTATAEDTRCLDWFLCLKRLPKKLLTLPPMWKDSK